MYFKRDHPLLRIGRHQASSISSVIFFTTENTESLLLLTDLKNLIRQDMIFRMKRKIVSWPGIMGARREFFFSPPISVVLKIDLHSQLNHTPRRNSIVGRGIRCVARNKPEQTFSPLHHLRLPFREQGFTSKVVTR
jgi:hypothetical protein